MENQDFVTKAVSINNFLIAAGEQAIKKGSTEDMQNFGREIVSDHSTSGGELLSMTANETFTYPVELLVREQKNLAYLTNLNGIEFERIFLTMMIAYHKESIELFEKAADKHGVPHQTLRAWAKVKLEKLEYYLECAQQLSKEPMLRTEAP